VTEAQAEQLAAEQLKTKHLGQLRKLAEAIKQGAASASRRAADAARRNTARKTAGSSTSWRGNGSAAAQDPEFGRGYEVVAGERADTPVRVVPDPVQHLHAAVDGILGTIGNRDEQLAHALVRDFQQLLLAVHRGEEAPEPSVRFVGAAQ
jgi:hypothetical protein